MLIVRSFVVVRHEGDVEFCAVRCLDGEFLVVRHTDDRIGDARVLRRLN